MRRRELENLEDHLKTHMELSSLGAAMQDTYAFEDDPPQEGYNVPKLLKDIQRDIGWNRPFTPTENREIVELLRKWTGQRQATRRRIDLATVDGVKVESDWRHLREDEGRPGHSKVGRYWYMPPLRGQAAGEPFKPVK